MYVSARGTISNTNKIAAIEVGRFPFTWTVNDSVVVAYRPIADDITPPHDPDTIPTYNFENSFLSDHLTPKKQPPAEYQVSSPSCLGDSVMSQ
ncbi:hypothetical protein AVEN_1495-1 [Araneus ventricosus]|uniref:Uncharacterized protein n=1 Tax=Araneus ventricosus TaxID=182803 RepID=A0A4Y2TI36_ARAVE|nr:hypothetical protein AVEN_1495-1 [Araneus ventricosus]